MVLFRFLFAPVLLAVAVLSAPSDRSAAPPPAAAAGAAHEAAQAPERDADAAARQAAPTRPAAGP